MKKQLSLGVMSLAIAFLTSNQVAAFSGSGNGTSDNPFVITTAAQLSEVKNGLSASYQLGADIDLTDWIAANSPDAGWEPIGYGTLDDPVPFTGTFDGAGHFITGLWINRPDRDYIGLFGEMNEKVEIKNLGVIIPEGKSVKGKESVGGLIGYLTNKPVESGNTLSISNVAVIGKVEGTKGVGALIGLANWVNPTITNTYAAGEVISAGDAAGGLIGSSWGNVTITLSNSYAVNAITAAPSSASAGGLLGGASANTATNIWLELSNNVAVNPAIDAGTTGRIFGFAKGGANINVSNYAFEGTLLNGEDEWFGELTNKSGEDATLSQIKSEAFYTGLGWDFANVWKLGNGNYPLPVLKGLTANLQPTVAPAHVPGNNSIADVKAGALSVVYKEGLLIITDKPANALVEVYDYSGRSLVKSSESSINVSSLASGIYLVKVGAQAAKFVKK